MVRGSSRALITWGRVARCGLGALVLTAGTAAFVPTSGPAAAAPVSAAGGSLPTTPATAGSTGAVVQIRDYNLSPGSIRVAPNSSLTFHNSGQATHRIVADDASFDSLELGPAGNFTTTLNVIGQVRVHCEIHPSMVATIVVAVPSDRDPTQPASTGSTVANAAVATTTSAALPNELAATGSGDTLLVVLALGCITIGAFAMAIHRRRQVAMATLPSESAWRSVTVSQRHFDDLLGRRRDR